MKSFKNTLRFVAERGDEALRICASRISAACRESDSVARYGGDEFVLLARHVELPDGAEIL